MAKNPKYWKCHRTRIVEVCHQIHQFLLHPNKDECTDKIVKAHAIQNNRILTKIAENGWIKTLNVTSNLIFQSSQEQGRKIATTFTGFCSYHDKKVFQAIEDQPFIATAKQIFLFTYRTMAWDLFEPI